MVDVDDYRLRDQARYLLGARLIRRPFVPDRYGWDVAHCAFCLVPFVDSARPAVMREGLVTLDGLHWICPACFEDFREGFGFQEEARSP